MLKMDVFGSCTTSQKLLCVVGGLVVSAITVRVIKKLLFKKKKKIWPKDTVIFTQIGRGPYAPSLTPFAIKLETYLRMAKIPYQNVHAFTPSSKGKFPWIEYNGEEVADTAIIMKYLNKKLSVDLNRSLSPADRGVAQALQCLVEDHLYWILVLFRWVYDNDKSLLTNSFKFASIVMWQVKRKITTQVWNQGLGRHTQAEIVEMLRTDLQSLDDFLGKKKFLFGDVACETDATVFGQLSQVYWQFTGTGYDYIVRDEYPNLASYCERMKSTFWPDWDECITHGWTKKATK